MEQKYANHLSILYSVHSNNIYFNFCCNCNNTNYCVICLFLKYQFKQLLSKYINKR